MANIIAIEPALFREDEAWFIFDDGRKVLRKREREVNASRSKLGFPMILSGGFDEPVQSQADGKYYTSKSALERSYRADGNPQGVEYACIGDKPVTPYERPTPTAEDEAQKDAAISRALDEHGL